MKLTLKKEQTESKSFLSASKFKFSLFARVDLSEREIELNDKYKLGNEILSILQLSDRSINITINILIRGLLFEGEDIGSLLQYEEEIKMSCQLFKSYIDVRSNYCGEEILDY